MRRWWLYARYRLPWWLFRWLLPSREPDRSAMVLDWRYRRWGRSAPWTGIPVGPAGSYVGDLEHICYPVCSCVRELAVVMPPT